MKLKRKVVALIIWWCEGTKKRRSKIWRNTFYCPVEVTNTNPVPIRIFKDFLINDLKVSNSKFKGQIQIHAGDDQKEIEKYWIKTIGISKKQLDKTIIRPKGNKPNKTKGTFKLRLYNKLIYIRLEQLLSKELALIGYGT